MQFIPDGMVRALEVTAKLVHDDIIYPEAGISNVTEWCKKDACWQRLQKKVNDLNNILPDSFKSELISKDKIAEEKKTARKVQKIDNGIEAQKRVLEIAGPDWNKLMIEGSRKKIFTPKETGVLQIAAQIPRKIPSEKQSMILVEVLEKALSEGIDLPAEA